MDASVATLLGYTHDELRSRFPESLDRIARKNDFAGKKVRKLGISFSSEQRTIVDAREG